MVCLVANLVVPIYIFLPAVSKSEINSIGWSASVTLQSPGPALALHPQFWHSSPESLCTTSDVWQTSYYIDYWLCSEDILGDHWLQLLPASLLLTLVKSTMDPPKNLTDTGERNPSNGDYKLDPLHRVYSIAEPKIALRQSPHVLLQLSWFSWPVNRYRSHLAHFNSFKRNCPHILLCLGSVSKFTNKDALESDALVRAS